MLFVPNEQDDGVIESLAANYFLREVALRWIGRKNTTKIRFNPWHMPQRYDWSTHGYIEHGRIVQGV